MKSVCGISGTASKSAEKVYDECRREHEQVIEPYLLVDERMVSGKW